MRRRHRQLQKTNSAPRLSRAGVFFVARDTFTGSVRNGGGKESERIKLRISVCLCEFLTLPFLSLCQSPHVSSRACGKERGWGYGSEVSLGHVCVQPAINRKKKKH